ncbi:MAG: AsmA-like C-terminal region-containing protein, partial [Longimicrobiales bacterium]
AQDFASLQTSGTMSVSGHVRGEYGPLAFPSFALNAQVENGTFRYPDLPQPARDIQLDLAVTNAGGDADSTVMNFRRVHAVLGNNPIDATLAIRTPVSDPDVDVRATGTLDLADVGRTVKLENVEELAGVIAADFTMRARQSDIDQAAYERVDAQGTIDISDFAFASATMPHALNVDEAHLQLSPRYAELSSFRGTIGSSDVRGSGRLENLLGFALQDEDLRGTATVHSNHFDLNEWRSDRTERPVIPVPPNIDFTLDATADRLTFGALDIADAGGGVHIKDERATLDDFRMDMLGGAMVATGFYETTTPEQPTFDVDLHLDAINIPQAFTAFTTVQTLAPVAKYAQGSVTADVTLNGAIGENMVPLFEVMTGIGNFETTSLVVQDFPAFGKLADALHVDRLRNPGFAALASSFEIRDGRLHVKPFDVDVGPIHMNVAGSNGIDRSLAYTLNVELPRSVLGAQANGVLASLASKTANLGVDLAAAEQVTVGVNVAGTVTDPALALDLSSATGSVREGVEQALRDEVDERTDAVQARVDSAAAEARRKAEEQRAALIAEAEERAAAIREEARELAETVRREGHARADSLEARATNPLARVAAKTAADKLRAEADASADRIVIEADQRAAALVEKARGNT